MKFFNLKPVLLAFLVSSMFVFVVLSVFAQQTCVFDDDCEDLCLSDGRTKARVCSGGACDDGGFFCDDGVGSYGVGDLFADDGRLCCTKFFEGKGSVNGVCTSRTGTCIDSVPHPTVQSVISVDAPDSEQISSGGSLTLGYAYRVKFSIDDADGIQYGGGSTTNVCLGPVGGIAYGLCESGKKSDADQVDDIGVGTAYSCTGQVTIGDLHCTCSLVGGECKNPTCISPGSFTAESVNFQDGVQLYARSDDASRSKYGPILQNSWDPALYEYHDVCQKFVCMGAGCLFTTGSTSPPPPQTNNLPVFSSSSSFSVSENVRRVGTVVASDSDSGDSVTGYVVSGGLDSARFSITSAGVLTFRSAPDYEIPADVGGNNVYDLMVTATSGSGGRVRTATQTIIVTVVDESLPVNPPVTPQCAGPTVNICDRTIQVQTEILAKNTGYRPDSCNEVSSCHLRLIERLSAFLNAQINALKVGDFDDLPNLRRIDLGGNRLVSLPRRVFANLNPKCGLYRP